MLPNPSLSPLAPATAAAWLATCVAKAGANVRRLAARPGAAAWAGDGDYFAAGDGFFEIGNWTSSFCTGMALLAYQHTGDATLLEPLGQLREVYRAKVTTHRRETMHDLGFLYSLYSVGLYRLAGDARDRATALQAAEVLAGRFRPEGGFIQAWGPMDEADTDYAGLAIIDCLMNLPLLWWASRETGDVRLAEIAHRHADTTRARFVRPDQSVCHAYRFHPWADRPVGPDNYCGYDVESQWARGTAWAIYGFALAYRHTGATAYLETARRLARAFCAQLDDEGVPPWDFRLPAGQPRLRDSSAAAIAVCGIDEICAHAHEPELAARADALLSRLGAPDYFNADPGCPGLLRQAEVGESFDPATRHVVPRSVYASWGDYFFMEALARRVQVRDVFW
ncbi:glycosyl hydrolase [Opitutus sp. ER46]|nr:glycosyl hydrolase [Opitutus sp. ER46]